MVTDMKKAPADLTRGSERNYGIDLLRIVAMLYVLVLHALGPGGILDAAAVGSAQYKLGWFMEAWTFCAVDIFALISGYVSYSERERKTSWTSYILLWLQVVFYGVAVTLVFNYFHPELVTKKDLFLALLPVSNGLYWYLNAYTGLFVIAPLLNAGVQKCSERTLRKVFLIMFLAFSVYDVVVRKMELVSGYSFVWVTILYLMGAIIRKCGIGRGLSFARAMIVCGVLCLAAWLWKMFGLEFIVLKVGVTKGLLISYISPAVVGIAILHVIGFSNLKFGGAFRKIISFAAPAAFAVYILNCHRIIWAQMVSAKFAVLATRPLHVMVFWVMLFSVVFLVVGILIDRARIWLFDRLRVKAIVERLVGIADKLVTCIAERL